MILSYNQSKKEIYKNIKERVKKEYFTRVRKISTSQLSAHNKVIAHSSFALPVLVHTFRILDWSIQDIKGQISKQESN